MDELVEFQRQRIIALMDKVAENEAKVRPIFIIEYPDYYSKEQVTDLHSDFHSKLQGYNIILVAKDIQELNFKF